MSGEPSGPVGATAPLSTGLHEALERAHVASRRVLLLVYHRDGVTTVALAAGTPVTVGREPPADVVVADASLSRRHARFTLVDNDEVELEDLGSTNGTIVGDKRVDRARIRPGEEVLLGAVTASLHIVRGGDRGALGLDGHDAFRTTLETEIQRSRYFGRTLGVVLVMTRAAAHLRHVWPRVRELLRPVDRAALYASDAIEILLPEATLEQAVEIARAIADASSHDAPLACGVAAFPAVATTADKLIALSRDAARTAKPNDPVRVAPLESARALVAGASSADADENLITESPRMRAIVETATRLARATIPVLVLGETGTGKERLARVIHHAGPRRDRPLVCINCGAIPAQLIESTLFGHERGAFTGASQQQKGVFEAADGGTVLLDEVGELPPAAQAALLRVLETKRITRVGSTKEIEVDVRVLAATHRDLEAMAEVGTFRSDLLYRLNAMTLSIPPLRDRREDIAPLSLAFLEQANEDNDASVHAIDPSALALLEGYVWPGNVRELKNAIERAVVIADGGTVTVRDLPERVRAAGGATLAASAPRPESVPPPAPGAADAPLPARSFRERMEELEAGVILEALRDANGNQTEAAKLLQLPLRTLQHKIKALGIKRLGYSGPMKPA